MDVIGVLELSSIAAGIAALDRMVKAAPVSVITARIVCPGKLVILITGDVASVGIALGCGREGNEDAVVDELFISNLHPLVIPAIRGRADAGEWDALGVVESLSVTAGVRAADAAAKEAEVRIPEVKLAGGMGGKSTVKITGPIHEVQAAVAAAVASIEPRGLLCRQVILPRPHPDIRPFVLGLPHEGTELWN